uniref:Heat shock 70 kDa protein 13 n=1 Tax=Ditylenchus dipsaci TaxID=166011 RepID=A0A915DRU6_9BILA
MTFSLQLEDLEESFVNLISGQIIKSATQKHSNKEITMKITCLNSCLLAQMSATISIIGTAVLAVLLAGYVAQKYGLPPPPPKIAGIDLGTTFSSIGFYQAVTGNTDILADELGKKSVPSVVGFLDNGEIVVGTRAVEQQETNPRNTIYDAKRFIGKTFKKDDLNFESDCKRYPFTIKLDQDGLAYFEVEQKGQTKKIRPEEIGSIIIKYMRDVAEKLHSKSIKEVVISVPAEFDTIQRNYTGQAAQLAGMEVRRVISEPTAAALAYGLHKKKGVEYVLVVDLGGGTLDVSVLWLNGGTFITQAMAGNNRLGGQDFNQQIQKMLIKLIEQKSNKALENKEDLQQLRLAVEAAKIQLTLLPETWVRLNLRSTGKFEYLLTRKEFEEVNKRLLDSIVEPITAALADCEIQPKDVDEIVLVGGSTRIPKVRQIVGTYFDKAPNFGVDPELAVVTGTSIQAGVLAGGWPLQVAAIELPPTRRKRHIYTDTSSSA